MSLLTSTIKGLAGVAKSDALKEAEKLLAPKPGFFSKLEEAVTGLNFTKMPSQQLRKTMEGRQVSPLEYDNVLGQMEGTVNKEEVMGMIGKNKTELKDVTLGGDKFEGWSDNKIRQFYEEQIGESSTGLNINQIRNNMSDPEFFDAETASKVFKGKTHYEQYSEPGYIPGSYRERFVTAPPKEAPDNNLLQEGQTEWRDGHSAYSNIQNPVVRLRTNDREVDGKKILFIEEIQGPSKDNQDKMPEFLRKRIYDIGVKKALMIAKEGGYDGVAWTTGEMQASRYNLSKRIDKISWSSSDRFNKIVDVWTKDNRLIPLKVNDEGIITSGEFFQRRLDEVVGKDISKNILDSIDGSLSNLDLKVGGEGLKYLYDKQLPSLFKKYGKEGVESINIVPEGKAKSSTLVKELRKYASAETDFGSEVFNQLHNVADFIEKGGVPKEARLKYITNERALAAYKRIIEDVFSMKFDVPYIPITKKTPSRHPVYSMIPPTLAGITAMYRTGEGNAQ